MHSLAGACTTFSIVHILQTEIMEEKKESQLTRRAYLSQTIAMLPLLSK